MPEFADALKTAYAKLPTSIQKKLGKLSMTGTRVGRNTGRGSHKGYDKDIGSIASLTDQEWTTLVKVFTSNNLSPVWWGKAAPGKGRNSYKWGWEYWHWGYAP